MYSAGPLITYMGKLDATPEVCSATLSAGDSMYVHCFSESVVSLKVHPRYFYGAFVVTPGLILPYVALYKSFRSLLSYFSQYFCFFINWRLGSIPTPRIIATWFYKSLWTSRLPVFVLINRKDSFSTSFHLPFLSHPNTNYFPFLWADMSSCIHFQTWIYVHFLLSHGHYFTGGGVQGWVDLDNCRIVNQNNPTRWKEYF